MMSASAPKAIHVCIRSEDGSYWATVAEYPGVFATGDDLEELRESLEEGISLVLADDDKPAPIHLAPLKIASEKPTPASSELVYA